MEGGRRPLHRGPRPGSSRPGSAPARGPRALFVGCSLTHANDMPLLVQAFARAAGQSLEVAALTKGGARLEDHWQRGAALARIEEGGWSFVVMQQGPSSVAANRESLREYARRFAGPIRKAGARPALYMVWPAADRRAFFDEVRISYALAAEDVDGLLIPAGEAWRAAWSRDPGIPLYRKDGLHPSPAGSFLVALSVFGMLCGRSPVGLPARVRLANGSFAQVPPGLARLLQEAAAEANQAYGRR